MFEPRRLGLGRGHRSDRHGVTERHPALALPRPFLAGRETDPESDVRLAGSARDSDMAPGFWRAKRQSTMPFIHSLAGRWPRAVGASFSGAMCTSRFVLPTAR